MHFCPDELNALLAIVVHVLPAARIWLAWAKELAIRMSHSPRTS
jgi:hypothetical protein